MDNVTKTIEEVCETICDYFCIYRDSCDENAECQWIREGNACPLDRLQ